MRLRNIALATIALCSSSILTSSAPEPPQARVFFSFLQGAEEVPPVDSAGRGLVILVTPRVEREMRYVMVTAGLEGVRQAHIHLGAQGQNGPVVAFLFGPADPAVTRNGLLSMGSISADDLIGPLAGQPLSALMEAIRNGNAYVNVHTLSDPAGEIRGQLGSLGFGGVRR